MAWAETSECNLAAAVMNQPPVGTELSFGGIPVRGVAVSLV